MAQFHPIQHGTFLITTNAKDRQPWCLFKNTPVILINTLVIAKRIQKAKVYAFCILPDHMHIVLSPGERGLSAFMKSFKENSSREIRRYRKHCINEFGIVSADVDVGADNATNIPPHADAVVGASQSGINLFHGWQHGFDSRGIGTDAGMNSAINYVESNAARHRLVRHSIDWPWTSLHFPHLL